MGRPAKRTTGNSSEGPKAKKAKSETPKVDPVQTKLDVVCKALANAEYEFPCRDMLRVTTPKSLGIARDERYHYQESVVEMLGEVFEAEEARRLALIDTAQGALQSANSEQEARETSKACAEAAVQAKKEEISAKEATLSEDSTSLKDAQEKLRDVTNEKCAAEASHQSLSTEKSECLATQEDNFRPMKEGTWETVRNQRQNIAPLKALFKKLSSDESMLNALPLALGKKPADRGHFDVMVVEKLESTIAQHIVSLDEKIEAAAADISQKTDSETAANDVLQAAKERQQGSSDALAAAQEELKQLQSDLRRAKAAVKSQEATVKQTESDLSTEQSKLSEFKAVMADLVDLRDRVAQPEPTEEADEKMEEVQTESVVEEKPIEVTKQLEETTPEISQKVSVEPVPSVTMTIVAGA